MLDIATFSALVDHTALKAETTQAQIDQLSAQCAQHGFASVCVNGAFVESVVSAGVTCCCVVGFPLGANSPIALAAETEQAVADGASEIDMVIPLGAMLSGDTVRVADSIRTVRTSAGSDVLVKVIIESAALNYAQIVQVCKIAVDQGCDYVKTSTGFHSSGGASAAAVSLMRETVGDDIGVKASGGIRTLDDVIAMVDAGASRLGMSAAMSVLEELNGSA